VDARDAAVGAKLVYAPRMKPIRLVCSIGLAALMACNKGEDQAKLDEAKREAATKVADAEREANEKKAAAERELAATKAKLDADRAQARVALQKDLAAHDRKALDLKERAAKVTGKVKLNAQAASAEYDKRRAAAERDLEGLNSATGDAWETLKAQAQKDVESVKTALDAFDNTLSH
jgi:hypothetical protein